MILVTGATGKVGTALVNALQARKAHFQAFAHAAASVEKLTQQGITVKSGTFDQPETIDAAMNGVKSLFLLNPSSPKQIQIENGIIDAANRAGITHIVKLSVYDAGQRIAALKTHGEIETHLKASGVPYTILQPNYFMQNFVVNDAPTVIHNSALFAPTGDAKISYIDARDIAEVAAIALTEPGHSNQTYEITGAAAYSFAEVAEMLTQRIAKPVQHIDLPSEAYRDALLKAGLPEWYATILQELFADYHAGYGARLSQAVQQVTGRPPRTIQAFFDEYAEAFR